MTETIAYIKNSLKDLYSPSEVNGMVRLIMEQVCHIPPHHYLTGRDTVVPENEKKRIKKITEHLRRMEPIQYILGRATFCGHSFEVCPGVLIPRPETEKLVSTVSTICSAIPSTDVSPSILDIGTGSGSIAVSLALEGYRVSAMDISPTALEVAERNATRLGAVITFFQDDILQPTHTAPRWDVIVSNPPYICLHEAAEMEPNVLMHEPHQALFVPDTDPLIFYRAIAAYAMSHLTPGGWLCLEINRAYPKEISLLLASFGFTDINITSDQYDNPRIASAHL